ncbi:MAG: hypothetical protein CFH18_00016 [Alphaproteobacteria bacterium MarineAlpha5_Bin8]|nr:MAG: hypothetical protein CFH17_00384 [Alphaproteobacteria bacterium MarineAlpha5_Bin7]PPR48400.1 MAG: hypothetical protein CFH18_00016 [Alphaproteobacteria bacterium MarineAlpha5_Bin8]PPR54397.1 MAG: hypothetical protein CFH16_00430 [Alphaproteobacteria bacterium MarineAlpha5_Bin6]|tara:strand:- start:7289 stop:8188 length:900 start_codon:yes stop_codon:yes gene_type:complete
MFRLLVLILVIINFSTKAEDNLLTLKQQVDRLQREVNDLSKSVFQNGANKRDVKIEKNDSTDLANITAFDIRIYDIENDIKNIYSNYEDISFQIEEMRNLIEEINIKLNTKFVSQVENNQDTETISEKNIEEENLETKNTLGTLKINSQDLSENSENVKVNDNENFVEDEPADLSPEEEYQLAYDLLRSQKFDQAKVALNEFIKKNSSNDLAGSAHYWLGEIYLLQKDYREAALIFAEGYQNYQSSVKAPDILYKLALVLTKIDKNLEACNTLIKFQQEYSDHKFMDKTSRKIKELECE